MKTTTLSNAGEVFIPPAMLQAQHWQTGQELTLEETTNGILLRAKAPFQPNISANLNEVIPPLETLVQPSKPTLWEALQAFRQELEIDSLDIDTTIFSLRTTDPGREVNL